ncbi:MAG: YitT family protein [Firmicutes bacterium]|nr:YitT family protein [Bacillota bacterium]MDY4972405.1 YitT family protein [Erysipelotrichaceae bacterium]MDY5997629.1 YitT family protein [Erysipelotrichaceae bacterium]
MFTKENIIDFIMITLGTFIIAISVFFFMMPSNLSVGSVSGLSIVISNFIPFNVSTISMVINILLLIFGFITIGKEFGIKTVYTSILLPIFIAIFEYLFPNNISLTADQTLDAICYCVIVSIGTAMLFNRNASSGGLDIIGKFLNKYFHLEVGKGIALSGMLVAISSILVYDMKTMIISILATYFSGIVLDNFLFGSTIKKRVCIISQKYQQILDFILNDLHSGATTYHAYGAYSDKMNIEINVIVDKNEYIKLINYITSVDPDAFVTIYAVNEMMYRPKVIK